MDTKTIRSALERANRFVDEFSSIADLRDVLEVLTEAYTARDKADKDAARAMKELSELTASVSDAQKELAGLKTRMQASTEKLWANWKRDFDARTQAEYETYRTTISDMEASVAKLTADVQALQNSKTQWEQHSQNARAEARRVAAEKEAIEKQLAEIKSRL